MAEPSSIRPIRIAARRSPLARAQADHVAGLLAARGVSSKFVGITTVGDLDARRLTEIGGTGVFVSGVRDALRRGEADLAVHSLKDLPTEPAPDLVVAAVPTREDPRDVLVGARLADLHDGFRIGTGAPRRAIQLLDLGTRRGVRLEVVPVRGNVGTRLKLVGRGVVDAVVLAAAGLRRLGHLGTNPLPPDEPATASASAEDRHPGHPGAVNLRTSDLRAADRPGEDLWVEGLPAEVLPESVMLPAPGQGALALEVSAAIDSDLLAALQALDDPYARAAVAAERAFLAALEAGCTAPVGARAIVKSVRGDVVNLTLTAVIGTTYLGNRSEPARSTSPWPETSGDAKPLWVQHVATTDDPARFGTEVASAVLAERSLQDNSPSPIAAGSTR